MFKLKTKIKELFTGLTFGQEYICLVNGNISFPLKVLLRSNQQRALDVTHLHLFIGYKPAIVCIFADVEIENEVQLLFSRTDVSDTLIAELTLLKVEERILNSKKVFFYKVVFGSHSFLNRVHQLINHQIEIRKKKRAGNVDLPGNLYDQVRILYAIPRSVSIITVGSFERMNLFPTDLHGSPMNGYYVISLRTEGLANRQVHECRKIVLSEVNSSWFRDAYALGKNHMRDLRTNEDFPIHPTEKSNLFGLPLPQAVLSYQEMEYLESFEVGIHCINIFKIVSQHEVSNQSFALTHVHQYYAQWRKNNRLTTEYLLR